MFRKSKVEAQLDDEIATQIKGLANVADDRAEYRKRLDDLEKLQKMKSSETKATPRVSPDTVFSAGVNLATVAMILKHEQLHVITSRAFSFVTKLRP